ncbi:MAG: TadE/TadG family type IV pilus assembly protein [Pseudoruminococcus massiliensis]|uniref:TadE/TadG family type IV pilus assembly protein n=1 Tax=Pseudoruminococcus massiliensis TaxID=2086583 RepID=UPI0039930890
MKKIKKMLLNDDSGEVMLESTIIFTITIFLLLALLSIGFIFYQKAMLNSVADEIASSVGATFKFKDSDLMEREIGSNELSSNQMYRYMFHRDDTLDAKKIKAKEYIGKRVGLTNLGISNKTPKVEDIKLYTDNIGRFHVTVDVSMETEILFMGVLKYFNIIDSTPRFTASSSAECLDITEYNSYLNMVHGVINGIAGDGTPLALVGKVVDIFDTVKGWITG